AAADMTSPARELLAGVRVGPHILSADFGSLREQVGEVLAAGARVIHVDVMDGHLVPPITVGPLVVAGLGEQVREAQALLDVHLMIERPERHVGEFVKAGAHSVTFHAEATSHASYAAGLIREAGACVGVAINPATPVGELAELTADLDLALCMTVNPGWGGQPFIEHSLQKLPRVRAIVGEDSTVEVDGGIDPATPAAWRGAGASVLVAAAAFFGSPDPGEAYRALAAPAQAPLAREGAAPDAVHGTRAPARPA